MTMPGFAAEMSLYRSRYQYRGVGRYAPTTGIVIPALRWGGLSDNGCAAESRGDHRFSAVLWDIPWGQDWITTCERTPGPGGEPIFSRLPDYCEEGWGNVWGNWYVPDASCGDKPCPLGCAPAAVSCTGVLLWCACWCPGPGGDHPEGGWWLCGGGLGVW